MSRHGRRKDVSRSPSKEKRADGPDLVLHKTRFDTDEASANLLKMRYLNPAWRGTRDNGVRLPGRDQSVSERPRSGGLVYRAFANGLMYGDQLTAIAGIGLLLGLMVIGSSTLQLFTGDTNPIVDVYASATEMGAFSFIVLLFLAVVMIAVSPLMLMAIASDLIGFRFQTSALFDRNSGKVHVFTDQSMPWAPWRCQVKSYGWECLHAEIDTFDVSLGQSRHAEARLWGVVMDGSDGSTVVDQFILGANTPASHLQPLLDTWEHTRRFMQLEGPLFASEDDGPDPSLGRRSLWRHLIALPKLHWSVMIDMFCIAWCDKNPMALFAGALAVVTLPGQSFIMFWGVLPWLSGLAKRDPIWPPDIIASVGGSALSGNALEALRGAAPSQTSPQQSAWGGNADLP